MDQIMDLCKERGIYVIEDCAQAHGSMYKGRRVGSIGDIAAWSFCQDKIMTTGGEGGMVTTNHHRHWNWMWSFKDHGKSYDAVYHRKHPSGFRWLHDSFGTNWRMMEIQAVIGRYQLSCMHNWTRTRNHYASVITAAASQFKCIYSPIFKCDRLNCSGECPQTSNCVHAQYKKYVYVCPADLKEGWTRDRIIQEVNAGGVPCYQGSCSEVYREKAFDNKNWRPEHRLPNAQKLGETSLMFLVHPTLKQEEIDLTCQVLADVLKQASK